MMTPQQAATLTTDQLRDWCAEDDGWQFDEPESCVPGGWWRWNARPTLKSRTWCKTHPHPPTLDGAAKAMPEGWEWWKDATDWIAQAPHSEFVYVRNTGDEMADRYRLAVLCRIAAKEAKG